MTTKLPTVRERIKEFKMQMTTLAIAGETATIEDYRDITNWLTSTLTSDRTTLCEVLVEKLEGMRKEQDGEVTMEFADGRVANIKAHSDMALGFNHALDDVIALVKETLTEKP